MSLRDTRSPGSNYLPNDWRWAASPTSMRKTSEGLQRVSDQFHFVVSMHTGGVGWGTYRREDWERDVASLAGNKACFILRNNIGQEATHLPLTPWMVMHRAIHHIHADSKTMLMLRDRGIFEGLVKIYNHLSGEECRTFSFGWDVLDNIKVFLKTILTTRAGRENKINNNLDIAAELFAQHHFGGIRLRRTKDWPETYPEDAYYTGMRKILVPAYETLERIRGNPETDRCLELLEFELSANCEEIGRALQNKLLIF